MKYCIRALLSILLLAALLVPALAQTDATVRSVSGKVEIQPAGGGWIPLAAGDRIAQGSTISTGFRSTAVLEVGSAVLEVKPLTRMRLDELIEREGVVKTELFLRVGRVKADVRQREGLQQDFRLSSPVSTAAVRGTSFEYDGVNLQVLEGLVAIANAYGQSIAVSGGQTVEIPELDLPPEGLAALEKLFDVNTSASQIEEIIEGLPTVETGSVTIPWEGPAF